MFSFVALSHTGKLQSFDTVGIHFSYHPDNLFLMEPFCKYSLYIKKFSWNPLLLSLLPLYLCTYLLEDALNLNLTEL